MFLRPRSGPAPAPLRPAHAGRMVRPHSAAPGEGVGPALRPGDAGRDGPGLSGPARGSRPGPGSREPAVDEGAGRAALGPRHLQPHLAPLPAVRPAPPAAAADARLAEAGQAARERLQRHHRPARRRPRARPPSAPRAGTLGARGWFRGADRRRG
jgi:hypothetical protein